MLWLFLSSSCVVRVLFLERLLDLTYAQSGYPHVFNAVLVYLWSLDYPTVLVGTFSAQSCRVLIPPSCVPKGDES